MNMATVGLVLAKNVLQVHGVDPQGHLVGDRGVEPHIASLARSSGVGDPGRYALMPCRA
jgi:hypothetical protein